MPFAPLRQPDKQKIVPRQPLARPPLLRVVKREVVKRAVSERLNKRLPLRKRVKVVEPFYNEPPYYPVRTVKLPERRLNGRAPLALQVVKPTKIPQQFFLKHF